MLVASNFFSKNRFSTDGLTKRRDPFIFLGEIERFPCQRSSDRTADQTTMTFGAEIAAQDLARDFITFPWRGGTLTQNAEHIREGLKEALDRDPEWWAGVLANQERLPDDLQEWVLYLNLEKTGERLASQKLGNAWYEEQPVTRHVCGARGFNYSDECGACQEATEMVRREPVPASEMSLYRYLATQ